MLTITANEVKAPHALKLKTAPGVEGTREPSDRVELSRIETQSAPPQNSNAAGWATAGLAAVAVLGAANGAAAQMAPPETGLTIVQPQVDPSQPLSARQLEDMRWATEFPAQSNARAQQIGQSYTRLVDKVQSQSSRFSQMVPKMQKMAGEVGSLGFSVHMNGDIVTVSEEGGVRKTTLVAGLTQKFELTERAESIALEHDGVTTTLYILNGFFHQAGDLLIRDSQETIAASSQGGTALQRESRQGEATLFETFESPENVITIFPNPVFNYEARGAENLSVTVRSDGSTRVHQNGNWTVEPGLD